MFSPDRAEETYANPLIAPANTAEGNAEFAALRTALEQARYTEPNVLAHLDLQRMSQFQMDPAVRRARPRSSPETALDLLIRLLLEGETISAEDVATLAPAELLRRFGILAPHPDQPGKFGGTTMLYPMHGLYIVADRYEPLAVKPGVRFDDIVYPAIVPNTDLFLELGQLTSSVVSCDAFLDLCAGTGIAALLAAKNGARHAYAYDIAERSTVFAEFNRRLNGISNATAARGDLYEPAGELTFDRIVAHPPYVPVYRPQFIFDSGGQDGEQIVRRIIEQLPKYLRAGGIFQSLTMGTDREQPFEQRVREWLGADEHEFDVLFVNRRTIEPGDWAAQRVISNNGSVADIANWQKFFKELGVRALSYGFLTIQRRGAVRSVFTVRRETGKQTGPAEHAASLKWETQLATRGASFLLDATPRVAPQIQMRVDHHIQGNEWVPENCLLQVDDPFSMELRAQPWIPYLLSFADGSQTGAQLLEKLKADGALPEETPPPEFASMLALLVSGGFLRVKS